jgi:HD-GYP domain-containing protein (c-di-GMP phosphodiesterase class II)/HAMP domain-containing protein
MPWPRTQNFATTFPARLFPIRIYIGVLFITLILVVGFCIGLYNFLENRRLLLNVGTVLFDRARQETQMTVDKLFAPGQLLVNVLSQQQIARAANLSQRLQSLPYMIEALNQHPPLAALYVGHRNGDFFLLRPLRTERERANWAAPAAARYLVQHVDRSQPAAPAGTYLFFDATGGIIERRPQAQYRFDPRVRPWYRLAQQAEKTVATEPYVFFSSREPGITLARRTTQGDSVVGADITLTAIAELLAQVKMSPSAELMLLDAGANVLAHSDPGAPRVVVDKDTLRLPRLDEFAQTASAALLRQQRAVRAYPFDHQREPWIGFVDRFSIANYHLTLAMAAPRAELLQDAERIRRNQAMLTALILLLSIPIAWMAGRWISRPLQQLAVHTQAIRAFDFTRPVARSRIMEVDQLAVAMDGMKRTISHFLDLSAALSSAQQLPRLLERVLAEAGNALQASGCSIYLNNDSGDRCDIAVSHGHAPALPRSIALAPDTGDNTGDGADLAQLCRVAIASGIPQVSATREDRQTSVVIPLFNRQGEAVGLIALTSPVDAAAPSKEAVGFVQALSGTAAISIEAQRSLEARKALLQALTQLIASAIDAKSPYTGGHCQRVPVIAKMLARAACDAGHGPFSDFNLSDDEWEALHLAAWLHDCGKLTTPEYVVDKATKLEMLYDRIHEVRMRFEVLKRDADIAYWRGLADGGDRAHLTAERDVAHRALEDDFTFVAQCNIGGEFMSPEQIERLKRVGRRTWLRTLDDRAGISADEARRKARTPPAPLPADEALLADRDDHLIERLPRDKMPPDNPWGFKLVVPHYQYNHGEFYNLSITRGTLSHEERYKICDHVVHTYVMLSKLPFPKPLRDVPDIAGSHHEKIDGSGYPRRLRGEQLSMPARMVAIADVFEALTAADRPYKPGKPLSETLAIMAAMRGEGHIDGDLFELFLRSGVYWEYARKYLKLEQIDVNDVQKFLE